MCCTISRDLTYANSVVLLIGYKRALNRMMKIKHNSFNFIIFFLVMPVILILVGISLGSCSNNNKADIRPSPQEKTTVKIGYIAVLPSGAELDTENMAMSDMVDYYNDRKLIHGIDLELITEYNNYDPSTYIQNYDQLKSNGVDIVFTFHSSIAEALKPLCEKDKIPLFTLATYDSVFVPTDYTFAFGVNPRNEVYTLLDWIKRSDQDFPKDMPAKIGVALWNNDYGRAVLEAVETYTESHPSQFQFLGGYLTDYSWDWTSEIEALNDCDYIFPPVPPMNFVRQYRSEGYSTRFIGTDSHAKFLHLIDNTDLWDEFDGMIIAKSSGWWNDEGIIIDLANATISEYRSNRSGSSLIPTPYLNHVSQVYLLFEVIRHTIETFGHDNFSSRSVYEAAQSFSIEVDGCSHSFNTSKRISSDALKIYEIDSIDKTLIGIDTKWIPLVHEP